MRSWWSRFCPRRQRESASILQASRSHGESDDYVVRCRRCGPRVGPRDVAARNIEAAYPADGAGSRSAAGHENRTDRLPVVVLDVAEEGRCCGQQPARRTVGDVELRGERSPCDRTLCPAHVASRLFSPRERCTSTFKRGSESLPTNQPPATSSLPGNRDGRDGRDGGGSRSPTRERSRVEVPPAGTACSVVSCAGARQGYPSHPSHPSGLACPCRFRGGSASGLFDVARQSLATCRSAVLASVPCIV